MLPGPAGPGRETSGPYGGRTTPSGERGKGDRALQWRAQRDRDRWRARRDAGRHRPARARRDGHGRRARPLSGGARLPQGRPAGPPSARPVERWQPRPGGAAARHGRRARRSGRPQPVSVARSAHPYPHRLAAPLRRAPSSQPQRHPAGAGLRRTRARAAGGGRVGHPGRDSRSDRGHRADRGRRAGDRGPGAVPGRCAGRALRAGAIGRARRGRLRPRFPRPAVVRRAGPVRTAGGVRGRGARLRHPDVPPQGPRYGTGRGGHHPGLARVPAWCGVCPRRGRQLAGDPLRGARGPPAHGRRGVHRLQRHRRRPVHP